MPSRHILLLYGTSYGQTAKIAARMRNVLLRHEDFDVTLIDAGTVGDNFDMSRFDGVIIGASIVNGRHQRSVRRFVDRHRDALAHVPSAFFSVSASAASVLPKTRAAAEKLREDFLKRMAWYPRLAACIAGAVNYTQYNPLLRWYVKQASRVNGGSTDTSRDHEYTNWAQVDQFAEDFASLIQPEAASPNPKLVLMGG